jgi:hypothetical protein
MLNKKVKCSYFVSEYINHDNDIYRHESKSIEFIYLELPRKIILTIIVYCGVGGLI